HDGKCDGAGACRFHAADVECAAGSCSAAVESGARTCDGAGVCRPASKKPCDPYACSGVVCATTCADDAGCVSPSFCDRAAQKCIGLRPAGGACAGANECATGMCVDGVCCQTACPGTCRACNVPGSEGTCANVLAGIDPADECAA